MKKPELLLPAGSKEKLEYAIKYGADAVYLGMVDFSLRSMRKGEIITAENLKNCVDLTHSLGAKAYLTLNIFAFNNDIENLIKNVDVIKDSKPDAIILSDFGIYNIVKKYLPEIDIHVSTQTNILNYETVRFWHDLGATRAILARELSIAEIAEIKNKVPEMELEVFVHGAQCVSFSGRCLISDYMTEGERKANHGGCAQPCRWSYKLVEETRPNEYFKIGQNERGTHILSPKDLALINYLPQLIEAGVDSFKIEGRTKSLYYVSAVAKAYREAIDEYCQTGKISPEKNTDEIIKIGNRGYTTGFFIDKPNSDGYSYDISKGLAGADFLCVFLEKVSVDDSDLLNLGVLPVLTPFFGKTQDCANQNYPISCQNIYKIKTKNKINLNDEIEIITPNEKYTTKVLKIFDTKNGEEKFLSNTNDEDWIIIEKEPEDYKYALARTIGIKNFSSSCMCNISEQ